MLHTGVSLDSVSLSDVLGDLIVDEGDDIESDWSGEDDGEVELVGDFRRVGVVVDWDGGSC